MGQPQHYPQLRHHTRLRVSPALTLAVAVRVWSGLRAHSLWSPPDKGALVGGWINHSHHGCGLSRISTYINHGQSYCIWPYICTAKAVNIEGISINSTVI